MKKELSIPVVVGVLVIAALMIGVVFYFGMFREPEVKFSAGPPAGLKGPPAPPSGMPAIPGPPSGK